MAAHKQQKSSKSGSPQSQKTPSGRTKSHTTQPGAKDTRKPDLRREESDRRPSSRQEERRSPERHSKSSRTSRSSGRGSQQSHSGESQTTTDHDTIRKWAEERGGVPATVEGTERGGEHAGLLRIKFPEADAAGRLEEISWDEFFEKFDQSNLAFLYQDETKGGGTSRFFKFVNR